ncbi:MAG: hypothetical protein Q7J15_04165 [Candidatus Desulfaltia sp.]|nr:hypothetical protein [Candidatus Desulfaltia sp.]
MTVRYITSGNEFAAKGLLGEGRHQLSILKNAMTFQNLKQLQRTVRFNDGTAIKCSSCFGQDVVNVFVPPGIPVAVEREIVKVEYCWCTNYFTSGVIKRIIGDYGDFGEYGEETYPDYCNSDDVAIKNYNGIRYEVTLCQGDMNSSYICLPSDFAEYEVDDKVIVYMRGKWNELILNEHQRKAGSSCKKDKDTDCKGCKGNRRPGRVGDEADGSFLIATLEIAGVNA